MLVPITTIIALNLLGFILAYARQTDKVTDLLYSVSFIALVLASHGFNTPWIEAHVVIALMVVVWAVRLGGYLFYRILHWGSDKRFDAMRPSATRYLGFWSLQTISIVIIGLPVMLALIDNPQPVSDLTLFGAVIWLLGFTIEATADWQKFRFKQNPVNKSKFIQSGLWRHIRHPNYLGEIIIWIGVFIACIPFLDGAEWIAVISPVWIFILLRYVSGIPLLEQSAARKYGDSEAYQRYLQTTGLLLPGFGTREKG
jgi:steroid 5-alpha reductase family enzyme